MSLRSWAPTARLADAAFAAGELAEALGDVAAARVHVELALEILRKRLGDRVGSAACRNSLGYLARAAGELDRCGGAARGSAGRAARRRGDPGRGDVARRTRSGRLPAR